MALFSSTVAYYRRFRPGIPAEVAAVLDRAAPPVGSPRRLLDLGTGTAAVIQALAGRFDDVIGVDTDQGMLDEAQTLLDGGGGAPVLPEGTRLQLVRAEAETFTPRPGWAAHLVTMSRSFHWMDQQRVLARLDGQVAPGGAVAILTDTNMWDAPTVWARAVRDVLHRFVGIGRVGTNHRRPPDQRLVESVFSQVHQVRIPIERSWTIPGIIGHLHSTARASPQRLGDRIDEFDQTLHHRLAQLGQDDFTEPAEFEITIGHR